jgi:hypothetical protein
LQACASRAEREREKFKLNCDELTNDLDKLRQLEKSAQERLEQNKHYHAKELAEAKVCGLVYFLAN